VSRPPLHQGLFRLLGYMLASARGLVDEPQLYGPFRLLDGASRLCGLLAASHDADEAAAAGDAAADVKFLKQLRPRSTAAGTA